MTWIVWTLNKYKLIGQYCYCLVINIIQNNLFCVLPKKENHTGLK